MSLNEVKPVGDDTVMRQELLAQIKARRASITAFVSDMKPRGARLNNVSIVSSAVTTVLTAGPALGGEKFSESVQKMFALSSDSTVWRLLCLGAMVFSITAAVATNMYKSNTGVEQISKAEAGNAKLEGLQTQVAFGQLSVAEALQQYQQAIAEIPFVPERAG